MPEWIHLVIKVSKRAQKKAGRKPKFGVIPGFSKTKVGLADFKIWYILIRIIWGKKVSKLFLHTWWSRSIIFKFTFNFKMKSELCMFKNLCKNYYSYLDLGVITFLTKIQNWCYKTNKKLVKTLLSKKFGWEKPLLSKKFGWQKPLPSMNFD